MQKGLTTEFVWIVFSKSIREFRGPHNAGYVKTEEHSFFLSRNCYCRGKTKHTLIAVQRKKVEETHGCGFHHDRRNIMLFYDSFVRCRSKVVYVSETLNRNAAR